MNKKFTNKTGIIISIFSSVVSMGFTAGFAIKSVIDGESLLKDTISSVKEIRDIVK